MMDSRNSDIFKSMTKSMNAMGSVDSLMDNLTGKVVDGVTGAVADTVKDNLNSSIEEMATDTVPKRDIESN